MHMVPRACGCIRKHAGPLLDADGYLRDAQQAEKAIKEASKQASNHSTVKHSTAQQFKAKHRKQSTESKARNQSAASTALQANHSQQSKANEAQQANHRKAQQAKHSKHSSDITGCGAKS